MKCSVGWLRWQIKQKEKLIVRDINCKISLVEIAKLPSSERKITCLDVVVLEPKDVLAVLVDYEEELRQLFDEFPNAYVKGSMPYLPLGSEWDKYFDEVTEWKKKAEKLFFGGKKETTTK